MPFNLRNGIILAIFTMAIGASIYAQGQGQGQAQAQGQGGAPGRQGGGRAPQNLKVLPKDMTGQQVQALMQTFRTALGVECTHCHVPSQQDRASDAKPQKETARKMIAMVAAINNDLLKGVGEPPAPGAPVVPKVTCFTCHRGALKPLTAPGAGGGVRPLFEEGH